jgi:hypothetical protein
MKCNICLFDTELWYNKNKEPQILKTLEYAPELGIILDIEGNLYYVCVVYKKDELIGVKPLEFSDEEEGF